MQFTFLFKILKFRKLKCVAMFYFAEDVEMQHALELGDLGPFFVSLPFFTKILLAIIINVDSDKGT